MVTYYINISVQPILKVVVRGATDTVGTRGFLALDFALPYIRDVIFYRYRAENLYLYQYRGDDLHQLSSLLGSSSFFGLSFWGSSSF